MPRSIGVFTLGLLALACASESSAPGLQVNVAVSNPSVVVGASFHIRAVVVNRGTDSAWVNSVDGGGPLLQGMTFTSLGDITAIGSWLQKLAPGDSIVLSMGTPPVASVPGDYTLSIRPFATPAGYFPIQVHVIASSSKAIH